MRYEVPQFIDVKNKIFGPFTVMQFLYMLGGGGFGYLAFRFIPQPFNYVVAIALVVLALMLAFYKYNSRPFIVMLEAMFYYAVRKKKYLWRHRETEEKETGATTTNSNVPVPQPPQTGDSVSTSKLKDLAWSLDIMDKS